MLAAIVKVSGVMDDEAFLAEMQKCFAQENGVWIHQNLLKKNVNSVYYAYLSARTVPFL